MADHNSQIDGAHSNLEKSWIEGVETHDGTYLLKILAIQNAHPHSVWDASKF